MLEIARVTMQDEEDVDVLGMEEEIAEQDDSDEDVAVEVDAETETEDSAVAGAAPAEVAESTASEEDSEAVPTEFSSDLSMTQMIAYGWISHNHVQNDSVFARSTRRLSSRHPMRVNESETHICTVPLDDGKPCYHFFKLTPAWEKGCAKLCRTDPRRKRQDPDASGTQWESSNVTDHVRKVHGIISKRKQTATIAAVQAVAQMGPPAKRIKDLQKKRNVEIVPEAHAHVSEGPKNAALPGTELSQCSLATSKGVCPYCNLFLLTIVWQLQLRSFRPWASTSHLNSSWKLL